MITAVIAVTSSVSTIGSCFPTGGSGEAIPAGTCCTSREAILPSHPAIILGETSGALIQGISCLQRVVPGAIFIIVSLTSTALTKLLYICLVNVEIVLSNIQVRLGYLLRKQNFRSELVPAHGLYF